VRPGGAPRVPQHLADLAQRLVHDTLGAAADITHLRVLGLRRDHWVLAADVTAPHPRVVVKLAGPEAEHAVDFARTAAVTTLVHRTGTPAPQVLATGDATANGRWRWQLLEHVGGTPWRALAPQLSREDLDDCHRLLAEALLGIQTVRFDGFGQLDADARPAPPSGWVDALRHRAAARIDDQRHRTAFLAVLDRMADAFADAGPPVLCHDDLHHDNVLFAPDGAGWRLTAVLDWDKSWAAPAQVDVARMAFWDDMTGPAFWEVYRAAVPESGGDTERACVYQLLWCLEYDVDTPRHREDTANVAARLGVRLG
jgi:aminoglycoside phosphotransferase (APT) family kinase protein